MIPLDTALGFAARGWRVFPCIQRGPRRKSPLTPNGFHDASTDPVAISAWWRRWPDALIGVATGRTSGFVLLDIDVRYADRYGFDTLDVLGFAVLPETPIAHTASGGLHLYFAPPDAVEIACTEGERGKGIGPGPDWRGRRRLRHPAISRQRLFLGSPLELRHRRARTDTSRVVSTGARTYCFRPTSEADDGAIAMAKPPSTAHAGGSSARLRGNRKQPSTPSASRSAPSPPLI
jgi:Bifunctional DNA primase/polymerase, N-terminal